MHRPREHRQVAPAVPNLRIYTLGPPKVAWQDRAFALSRRQARALLYRLAAELEHVPRETLSFIFWSDAPESTARRNLSRLLSHLRNTLPDPGLIVTSGEYVGLDRDRVWSDAAAFVHLCAATPDGSTPEALEQAVGLYRGPFLEGFALPGNGEYEEWANAERGVLQRQYLDALSGLCDSYASAGAHDKAIAAAERYLAVDELSEEVHRRLIELYAARGDRGAAIRQFEKCTAVLERELGVDPLPETRAVYQTVLERSASEDPTVLAEPKWGTLPSMDAPLIGREEALLTIERAYNQARSGRGSVMLISGEAGIGKSRLVADFAVRLPESARVLRGAAQPGSQTLPYGPLMQMFRSTLLSRVAVSDIWLAEASRLLPELRLQYPDLPQPVLGEREEARGRLFEALRQLVLSLAEGAHPLLICIDDLHWSDAATLTWLEYLGSQLRGQRILVLGTVRGDESAAVNALRRSLGREGVLAELTLRGLGQSDVRKLLRHLVGPDCGSAKLAERLWRATGGNPFFLLETVRALIEEGRLAEAALEQVNLPLAHQVREAVTARLERLSPVARQVLEAGAVLGTSFSFDLVQKTAGRAALEVTDGLDEALARQLLVEEPDCYRFQHEIIQTVVYQNLSRSRRRLLHRRAGAALQALRFTDATKLSWHYERGELPQQSAVFALQAGDAAKPVFAYADAKTHFDRALALLEDGATHLDHSEAINANHRLQVQALYGRGWAFRLLGDMEEYERDSREVARLAALLGDQRTLAHLRWREAYAHRWFCRYREALKAAREGVSLAQVAGEAHLEAMCHREIGVSARETGAYAEAQAALDSALDRFVALGDVVHEVHTLGNLSTLHRYREELGQALEVAQRALVRCQQMGLSFERRLPLGDIGAAASALGDSDLARACLEESLEIARQIADRTQEIVCLGHLGWLCVRLERPAEALEHLQAGLALAERIHSCSEQSWLLTGLAEAFYLCGDVERAVAHARRAIAVAQAMGRTLDLPAAERVLAATTR
jgi:predicted ATPase/DNA-binding SARP family transcriptional activator